MPVECVCYVFFVNLYSKILVAQNLLNLPIFRGLKKIVTPLFAGLLGGEMNFDRFFQEVTAIVIQKCVA